MNNEICSLLNKTIPKFQAACAEYFDCNYMLVQYLYMRNCDSDLICITHNKFSRSCGIY